MVNKLYELNERTRLDQRQLEYRSVPGTDDLNHSFDVLVMCWNRPLEFTHSGCTASVRISSG